MDHDQARNFGDNDAEKPVVEIDIKNVYDASEYASLESYVEKLPGTVGVKLDRTRGVAHVSYNPAVTTPEKLWGALRRCGYECDCYYALRRVQLASFIISSRFSSVAKNSASLN
jgi:hypothetical protein